jgi:hypothetical protein
VDVSLFPKRSKDAAFTGNQDGCLHNVVARFQRASECGILPPVGVSLSLFPQCGSHQDWQLAPDWDIHTA